MSSGNSDRAVDDSAKRGFAPLNDDVKGASGESTSPDDDADGDSVEDEYDCCNWAGELGELICKEAEAGRQAAGVPVSAAFGRSCCCSSIKNLLDPEGKFEDAAWQRCRMWAHKLHSTMNSNG